MYTTYHLNSAQDINGDILESIKAAFKGRPIKIIITEDDSDYELDDDLINTLEDRIKSDNSEFVSAEQSLKHLNQKYGL